VETRLAGAPSAVSAVNPSAPPATSPARADAVARR
jgi:hypothetical protein